MGGKHSTVEQKLARIASSEWGVVTTRELLLAGVSERQIAGRVEKGLLIREYRGVYRVGHRAPSTEARYLAAVKACGEGAVLAGLAAAHLYGLLRGSPPQPEVVARIERRIEGIETRRRRMHRGDITSFRGIPILTVPAVLVDIARRVSVDRLARACHEAGVRYGTTPAHVKAVLARRPRSPGAQKLRHVMEGDAKVVLSELERGFLKLLRDHGLPLPETNRPAGSKRVDCRWPEHKLTVELDSYRYHNSRHSWEQDRLRERQARKRKDRYRRYTWADVFEDWRDTLSEVRGLLGWRRVLG
jgi:hypothetical protein